MIYDMVLKIKFEKVYINCLGQCSQFESYEFHFRRIHVILSSVVLSHSASLSAEFHASVSVINPH